MSDDSIWGPPSGPPAAPPAAPPVDVPVDVTVADRVGPPQRRGRAASMGAAVAVLVIGIAGVFAVTRLLGGEEGGAASPEELGQRLFEALDDSDVLGLADLILPSERDTFLEPLRDLVDELRRIELVAPPGGADGIEGVTFEVARTSVRVRPTNVPDIVGLELRGEVAITIDGRSLPIGDLLLDLVGDLDPAELDVRETEPFDTALTAVRHDGRWYLSVSFTLAEAIRADMSPRPDIPVVGIEPRGAATPEGAIELVLEGVERLDLEQIVAALNPGEAAALHRYGPAFLPDAQLELDRLPLRWEVTAADLVTSGRGSTRTVEVERLAIEGRFDGVPFALEVAGGCVRGSAEGERFDSCEQATGDPSLDDVLGDSAAGRELLSLLDRVLAGHAGPAVTVRQVDGQWFVSPVGTMFDQLLAVLRMIDRDDVERFVELVPAVVDDAFGGSTAWGDDPFVGDPFADDPVTDDLFADDPFADDPFAAGPLDDCYALAEVDEAIRCFRVGLDAGTIDPFEVPLELLYPECGAAEASWEGYFALSDDEFIELVERTRPCFRDLVERGEISEFELPLAMADPECFEGRNWFSVFDDPEYDERVFECAGF